jgi:hypothetical protein
MLKKIATATSIIAILAGYTLPGVAQSIYNEPTKTPTVAPSTDMQPTMQPSTMPSTEAQPLSPSSAPIAPTPEVAPVTPETTPTKPSTEMQAPLTPAPPTETQPAVPSTSTPVTTPSAQVKPTEMTAKTTVLKEETITGIKEVSRACAMDKPAFVRVVGDQQVPFVINGTEGKVRMNANDKPVCSA